MKIDATCIDEQGREAVVFVDLDYVSDEEEVREWILEELYNKCIKNAKSFDTRNFVVTNWDNLIKEVRKVYV